MPPDCNFDIWASKNSSKMVGAALAVGAAASLASSILGAVKSANAGKKANALINTQRADNKKWYDTQMGQDYLQRSDAQAILKKQKELLDAQYDRARATNAVVGGTDEALAMQQAKANETLADTMTNMAAQSSAYKDSIEQQYRQQDAALAQQQIAQAKGQSQQIAQAAGQGVSAGLNLMGSAIGAGGIKKSKN